MTFYLTVSRENLLDNVVNKKFLEINKTILNSLELFVQKHVSNLDHAKHLVVDLTGLVDTDDEVIQSVNTLNTVYDNMRIVVLADREDVKEKRKELLRRIHAKGVYNIITTFSEEELEHCILTGKTEDEGKSAFFGKPAQSSQVAQPTDFNMSQSQAIVSRLVNSESTSLSTSAPATVNKPKGKILANKDFRKYKEYISIGVCGSENHIGCTHNALLIARFLKDIGFKVAYLEANENHDIITLNQGSSQQVMHNESKKLLQAAGVNLFYSGFNMVKVMAEKCDFYIFDLGVLRKDNVELFLMRDIKILVGGTKAWEFTKVKGIVEILGTKNTIHYLLNFTVESEKARLLSQMEGAKSDTFFTEYEPNPLAAGANLEIYKSIFREYIRQDEVSKAQVSKRRKGIFG